MANPSQLLLRPSFVGAESLFPSRAFLQCRIASRRIPESLKSTSLHSGRGSNFRCRAEVVLPESREEAIAQAAGSVSSLLENLLKRQGGPSTVKQQRKQQKQKQTKLRVEIPVLDDTPASLVSLTLDFLSSLKREDLTVAVFFSDASSAALARERNPNPNQSFHELGDVAPGTGVSVVVVAGARGDGLQELARNVSPRPIVVLNPEWTREDEEADAFLGSFEAAYAFLPLAIQGFLSKTEGAVLKKNVSPWLIFVKENNGKFTRLASLQRRPGPAELESALYNAMAANSPVTKSIKFLRGLVSKE